MAFTCTPNPWVSASKSMITSFQSPKFSLPKYRPQIRHIPTSLSKFPIKKTVKKASIVCEVALEETAEDLQLKAKVGERVRVRGPLKVYHVPKTPELDIGGMEGEVKDYVAIWKGKQISANLPYKVQFSLESEGRAVKFFAHLKEDEFDVVS